MKFTWALLTPKNISSNNIVKNLILGLIYSKPKSKKKTLSLDYIAETYNFLNAKYGKGTYCILAGDTNDLKLDAILNLSPDKV